jgi:hypothetical protein
MLLDQDVTSMKVLIDSPNVTVFPEVCVKPNSMDKELLTGPRILGRISDNDFEFVIDKLMPLGRAGTPDKNYNDILVVDSVSDRDHNRVLRWSIILISIPQEYRSKIVIYGASRYSLSVCRDLSIRVMEPQSRDEFEAYGVTIIAHASHGDKLILDPFNMIWTENMYEVNRDAVDIMEQSFKQLEFMGRLGKSRTVGSNVGGGVPGFVAIPFISHKLEYYFLHESIPTTLFRWSVKPDGVFGDSLGKFVPSDRRIGPLSVCLMANMYRNHLILNDIKVNTRPVYFVELRKFLMKMAEVYGASTEIAIQTFTKLRSNFYLYCVNAFYDNLDKSLIAEF